MDKIGGVASGEAFTPKRVAQKRYAVCEIVRSVLERHDGGAKIVETVGRVRVIEEYDHEPLADRMAQKHAVEIAVAADPVCSRTVTVLPVWRVR